MHARAAGMVSLALVLWTPARGDPTFDALAARSDLAIFGQVLQVGELDGAPAATVAIDRQLRGVEAAGALTFTGDVAGWRVGDRSVFFLRRIGAPVPGPQFVAVAGRSDSLAASAGLLGTEPVRVASYRLESDMPGPEGGISLPGIAAGIVTALGILALARLRR